MKFPAGEWLPDKPPYAHPGVVDVRNAIPRGSHYGPLRSLALLSEQSMPIPAQGLFVARRNSDLVQVYGGGDRLWRVPSQTGALQDISRGDSGYDYLFDPGDRWRGVQFGDQLILTNFRDEIQSLDLTTALQFQDLDATAPRAKYIAVVQDFVVVGYTFDSIDGEDGTRVRWHGIVGGLPDPTSWTISLSTQADFQRIADQGAITGLTGGEFGTVLCERGIVRMTYGGSALFRVDTVSNNSIGCNAPGSVLQYGQNTYFWSEQGWHRFDGQGVTPIGTERIDRWFANDFDLGSESSMWAHPLYEFGVLAWLYAGAGHVNGMPNRLLIYNPRTDQWGKADVTADILGPVLGFGLDLDNETEFPDMDLDERNMDDPRLWLTSIRSGAVLDDELKAFSGTAMEAIFDLTEFDGNPGGRFLMNRAEVIYDGGIPFLRVGKRERQSGTLTFGNTYSRQDDGWFRFREAGRRHRVRVEMTGSWKSFQGCEAFGTNLGQR